MYRTGVCRSLGSKGHGGVDVAGIEVANKETRGVGVACAHRVNGINLGNATLVNRHAVEAEAPERAHRHHDERASQPVRAMHELLRILTTKPLSGEERNVNRRTDVREIRVIVIGREIVGQRHDAVNQLKKLVNSGIVGRMAHVVAREQLKVLARNAHPQQVGHRVAPTAEKDALSVNQPHSRPRRSAMGHTAAIRLNAFVC